MGGRSSQTFTRKNSPCHPAERYHHDEPFITQFGHAEARGRISLAHKHRARGELCVQTGGVGISKKNMEIHPPRLDATCMAICEYQPPLSCGLFLKVPHCDWALIFGLAPPALGRWRGAVGTSNSQPTKHLNCVEGWVNGRTSPDFNRHNFGR